MSWYTHGGPIHGMRGPALAEHDEGPAPAKEEIFRAEALEHRARPREYGEVVKLAPRWTGWAFYALIACVLAAIVAAGLVRIETRMHGIASVDEGGRVVVLLPVALGPRATPGTPVRLGTITAEVVSSGEPLDPAEARSRYGVDVATTSLPVLTSARDDGDVTGSVAVLVESEPLIVALVPGLRALLGR